MAVGFFFLSRFFWWRVLPHGVFEGPRDFVTKTGGGLVVFLFNRISLCVPQLDELSLFLSAHNCTSGALAFVFDVFVNVFQQAAKARS